MSLGPNKKSPRELLAGAFSYIWLAPVSLEEVVSASNPRNQRDYPLPGPGNTPGPLYRVCSAMATLSGTSDVNLDAVKQGTSFTVSGSGMPVPVPEE